MARPRRRESGGPPATSPRAGVELVRDGVNGLIFPAGDLNALTQALLDVTDPQRIDAMKAASRDVLDDWRRRADPVRGLRQALVDCGVLPSRGVHDAAAIVTPAA